MNNQTAPTVFSRVFGLGAVQQVHPVRKSNRAGNVIAAGIFLIVAVGVFIAGLWYTYEQWQHFGPAVLFRSILPFLIVAAVCGLIVLAVAWAAYSNWNKAVVIYQNGLAYADRKGVKSWRWDEFASMTSAVTKHYTNGIYTGTTHVYTLVKNDGDKIVLSDSLTKVEEVSKVIRTNIFPLLYQKHAEAYNAGQRVTFGPVSISKSGGIQIGKKDYPWDQVEQVSIHQGAVRVAKKGGGWFSGATAMASAIPNLEVMLSIIDQVSGVKLK